MIYLLAGAIGCAGNALLITYDVLSTPAEEPEDSTSSLPSFRPCTPELSESAMRILGIAIVVLAIAIPLFIFAAPVTCLLGVKLFLVSGAGVLTGIGAGILLGIILRSIAAVAQQHFAQNQG